MKCFLCDQSDKDKELVGRRNFGLIEKVVCEDCVRLANAVFARKEKIEHLDFIRRG